MTTLEAGFALSQEYSLPDNDFIDLVRSYDGFTPTERLLSISQVEAARNASSVDPKTLAAAMFTVSEEIRLYFYFDLDPEQIPFGD